jgi:hypothetical protein
MRHLQRIVQREFKRIAGLMSTGLIVVMGLASQIAAAEVRSADPLNDALAVLKVNDPRLLDREATQFATGIGIDPSPIRAGLARLLFRSRNMNGIDLARPALMAWRKENPPLLAIIPLSDRRAFLESFGASFGDDAPLIRVSERDGTVVYTQNGNDGLMEYRLLVSDRAAYLARTMHECRALAGHQLPSVTTEGSLVFRGNAEYLSRFSSEMVIGKGDERITNGIAAFSSGLNQMRTAALAAWNAFLSQITSFEITVHPDRDGNFVFSLSIQSLEESQLSVWISNQRNQPSRLLPVVKSPNSLLTMTGNIVWQGQAEQVGQIIMPAVRDQIGERWNPAVDENWTALWRLADRAGPFALGADIGWVNGTAVTESRYLSDQQNAQEMLSLITLISQALTGRIGEVVSAGAATGYRDRQEQNDAVLVANERYLISIRSSMRDATVVAGELSERSMQVGAPQGAAGIVIGAINLSPLVNSLVLKLGGEQQPALPDAVIGITVKAGLPGQLTMEGSFPAGRFAQLLRDSGLMQLLH